MPFIEDKDIKYNLLNKEESTNILIERADIEDVSKLIQVQNDSFKDDVIKYGECPSYEEAPDKMEEFVKTRIIYKVIADNKIIGDVIIRQCPNNEYYIRVLSVIPEYQNKGIGTKILNYVFNNHPDAVRWTLITPKDNTRNCHFYEKLGFKKIFEDVKSEKLTLNGYLKEVQK